MKFLLSAISSFFLLIGDEDPYVVILGITQDGGYPQAGCIKSCCKDLWGVNSKKVSCIGIVDPPSKKSWMVDSTPDFPEQYHILKEHHQSKIEGIFLTHAHVGHYTGLLNFGKEIMGSNKISVFTMPKMKLFLINNAPWSQLIKINNIELIPIFKDREIQLNSHLIIEPILVPHRDEFSETVGFKIMGSKKSLVYIPDIDKWNVWERDIIKIILNNDFILIDGTFYANNEIPNRDMSMIPHPFITESMELFSTLNTINRNKVYFIHLNHTNPAIKNNSAAFNRIRSKRFNIAQEGQKFNL